MTREHIQGGTPRRSIFRIDLLRTVQFRSYAEVWIPRLREVANAFKAIGVLTMALFLYLAYCDLRGMLPIPDFNIFMQIIFFGLYPIGFFLHMLCQTIEDLLELD